MAPVRLLVVLALVGCEDIEATLGLRGPPDAAVAPIAVGRTVQGIPVMAGAQVLFGGYLESDYQLELSIPAVTVADAVRYYDGALRAQGWQGVQVAMEGMEGIAQTVRAKRGSRLLAGRFEVAEDGVHVELLLSPVAAPAADFAPVRDLEPRAEDGGVPDGAAPPPALPQGVPLPTGFRLVSNRALVGGGWEVVLEVDAPAEAARGRLQSEMTMMGWRFGGGPAARAPVSAPVADAPLLAERGGVQLTLSTTEAAGPSGAAVTTIRLAGFPTQD